MSLVMMTTITPPVTVVCSRASPVTMTVTIAPTCMGLAASGQHDVVLLLQVIPKDTLRGSVGLATVPPQQQPQSQMPF